MVLPIRLYGDPVLRRAAREVTSFDETLVRLAEDMIETMHDASGVGLAAPQVGISMRLFVALELETVSAEDEAPDSDFDVASMDEGEVGDQEEQEHTRVKATHVMVNPVLVHAEGQQIAPDGCLSIPGLWFDEMVRDLHVSVRYQDLLGDWHECSAEGHFAHVIQHELDHLDGVLYFDRLPDDQRRAFLETHRQELAEMQRKAKAMLKQIAYES